MKTRFLVFFLGLIISILGQAQYSYKKPVQLNDGWQAGSLPGVGIDTSKIEEITRQILTETRFENICSYLIIKNGKLVHEMYNPYYQRNSIYPLASVTKTFTSTLVGIAIDKGYIKDVNARLIDFLPEYKDLFKDPGKKKITIKHLMSMSSGMAWIENVSYNNQRNSEWQMVNSGDWIEFVLKTPMKHEPGKVFSYNTGGIHLLSAVIKNKTGLFINRFAEKYLLHPLGIFAYQWNRDSRGFPCTGGTDGGINLRTRDLAKFGWIFMKGGKWKGNQIVSRDWIQEATRPRFRRGSQYYGYNWFSGEMAVKGKSYPFKASFGFGGQTMYLVPSLDLILVFTCELSDEPSYVWIPVRKTFEAIVK